MNIRSMSLAAAMRSDELVAHLHRLRHPAGWFGSLIDYLGPPAREKILVLIASVGGHPIGVMMIETSSSTTTTGGGCGIFIDKDYRRRGVGRTLMEEGYRLYGPNLRCCPGDDASMSFFEKLKPSLKLDISDFAMPKAS